MIRRCWERGIIIETRIKASRNVVFIVGRSTILRCLSIVLIFAVCSGLHNDHRPNLILIGIDTWRADYFGGDRGARLATPNLESLAEDGVHFSETISPVPLTLPSFCSIMTGLTPPRHGVRDNDDYRLSDAAKTMAETLNEHGYETHAVIGAFVLNSSYGLNQGFNGYDDEFINRKGDHYSYEERSADEVLDATIHWLETRRHRGPFFLFVHFFDPHAPYIPPEPFRSQNPEHPYAGEVAYVDHCVGELLRHLKDHRLYDRSLILALGDHGESLGSHDELSHSYYVYDSTARVPLILKPSDSMESKQPTTYQSSPDIQAGLVDVLPTVLEAMGMPPVDCDGISLWPYVIHGNLPREQISGRYIETVTPIRFGWSPLCAIRENEMKYIEAPMAELYDLATDPTESRNLIYEEPQQAARLRTRLDSLARAYAEKALPSESIVLDQRSREALTALGYLVGTSNRTIAHHDQSLGDSLGTTISPVRSDLKDPKEMLNQYRQIKRANHLMSSGDYQQAIRLYSDILRRHPGMDRIHASLAYAYLITEDFERAISTYRRSVEINPRNGLAHIQLGYALKAAGRQDEALDAYVTASLAGSVWGYEAAMGIGLILAEKNDHERAVTEFKKALSIRPLSHSCLHNLAMALLQLGRYEEARDYVDRALRVNAASEYTQELDQYLTTLGY